MTREIFQLPPPTDQGVSLYLLDDEQIFREPPPRKEHPTESAWTQRVVDIIRSNNGTCQEILDLDSDSVEHVPDELKQRIQSLAGELLNLLQDRDELMMAHYRRLQDLRRA